MEIAERENQESKFSYTEYGIPIRNIWHMLLYAWKDYPINRVGDIKNFENAPSLDALLAMILCNLLEQRFKIGIGRNYIDKKFLLRNLRGKIDFSDSIKKQTFDRGQIYCKTQEFSVNVPKNQIIRSTLVRLNQLGTFGSDVQKANELHRKLRYLIRELEGIDLIELNPNIIRRQQFGRNDQDYRLMLNICELIFLKLMPINDNGNTYLPSIKQENLVLAKIYESFVTNFYRLNLADWKVSSQKQFKWHETISSKYLPIMKPDIFLVNKNIGKAIIMDTKFTASSLKANQWNNLSFDSSHIYQIYAYIKSQEHISEMFSKSTGILLYPTIDQNELSEKITIHDHNIYFQTIDLTQPWQTIESRLLDIIKLV